jgi:hypothetical protein
VGKRAVGGDVEGPESRFFLFFGFGGLLEDEDATAGRFRCCCLRGDGFSPNGKSEDPWASLLEQSPGAWPKERFISSRLPSSSVLPPLGAVREGGRWSVDERRRAQNEGG